jgi:hypothetical protein
MFLSRMSAYLVRRISELNGGTEEEKFSLATLVASRLFAKVTTRNDGFGVFGAVGSFHKKAQYYFLQIIWKTIEVNFTEFWVAIAEDSDAYLSSTGDCAVASNGNTRVVAVTKGSPGSLTLDRNAGFTGRSPIMPVLLARVNMKPAGLQQKNAGSFRCAIAATTTVNDTGVPVHSRIHLTPTNAAAATLWGSAKALYISAKSARASFTVATANVSNAAGTETFDYLIEG